MAEEIKDKKIEVTAVARKETVRLSYLRVTPRKAAAIAGLLRGLSVNEAEAQLVMQGRRAAKPILKLLRSAIAGAARNSHLSSDKLYIESIRVDKGPMLKRMLPRAKGMASPIQKKMSHVTLVLSENPSPKSSRFKIQVKKKVKAVKEREEIKKGNKNVADKEQPEAVSPRQKQNPGFFKKVFRRKSMV